MHDDGRSPPPATANHDRPAGTLRFHRAHAAYADPIALFPQREEKARREYHLFKIDGLGCFYLDEQDGGGFLRRCWGDA